MKRDSEGLPKGGEVEPVFHMGGNTLKIPLEIHRHHRHKVCQMLKDSPGFVSEAPSFILLQGGKQHTRNWTDHEPLFRQESFFQYLFGVREPDFFGAVEVESGRSILFIPRLPEDYAIWMGKINPPSYFMQRYLVDEVRFTDEIDAVLKEKGAKKLYLLQGLNTDSGETHQPATFPGISAFNQDLSTLHPVLCEARTLKSAGEIAILRYTNQLSSTAHVEVMRSCRPGMREYQLESRFLSETYEKWGCRHVSYACICGAGNHGSTLHYGHAAAPNDGEVKDGDMVLLDMGAEYHCYASDITCSYPANGKFSEKQKGIYNAVLRAQLEVFKAMGPGVSWPQMHRLAERVIAEDLLKLKLLQGSVEELMANHIAHLFMPHGLGHLMGLDTHDVGGYPSGITRSKEPGLNKLRCGRILQPGMVITVEPGIYFIDFVLDRALKDEKQAKFLNADLLQEYRGFGGVRLEDNVLITEGGIENLTNCPRTVEDVEAVMAGAPWPRK